MYSSYHDSQTGAFLYLNLVTERFDETWAFYTELLGFGTLLAEDSYVRLFHPSGVQLGFMRHETHELHPELVSATEGRGFWLNLEVADSGWEYKRLCDAGVTVVRPLEAQSCGGCSFTIRDPNGVLICVTEVGRPLSPAEEVESCRSE